MKKMLSLVFAGLLAFGGMLQDAFAITYTVTSREEFSDVNGDSKKRIRGTIAFDSDYPCDTTTGRCGEDLLPSQIGLTTIEAFQVRANEAVGDAGNEGLFIWAYHSTGTSGSGGTAGNLRAYYFDGTGKGNFASVPTYPLAALDAVPFEAIGA